MKVGQNDGRTAQDIYLCPSLYKGRTGQIYIGGLSCLSTSKGRIIRLGFNIDVLAAKRKRNAQNVDNLAFVHKIPQKQNIIWCPFLVLLDGQDKSPYIVKCPRPCPSCLLSGFQTTAKTAFKIFFGLTF